MVYEDISKQNIGFLEQATDLEDPIDNVGIDFYRFGLQEKSIGNFPTMDNEVATQYYGNERKPQHAIIAGSKLAKPLAFNAVNSLYWAHHWGTVFHSAAAEPDKVKTIVPSAIGVDLAKLAVRWQTDNIYRVGLNTRIKAANISFVRNQRLIAGVTINSEKVVNADLQSDHTPIFPTSEDGVYLTGQGDTVSFKWDTTLAADANGKNIYSSGGVDYSDQLLSLNFSSIMLSDLAKDAQDMYYKFYEGRYAFALKGSILRFTDTNQEKIYTDAEYQRENQTFHNAHFKIFNGTSKYFQLDMEDCILTKIDINNVTLAESPSNAQIYDFEAIVLSPVITTLDGVNSTLYP